MNPTQIKKNISDARNALNLTQAEMAEKIGISRQAYLNLENGKTSPINKQITKMAESCGITEEKILFGYSYAEMESSQLRETETLKERILDLEEEKYRETADLKMRVEDLSELLASERQHVRTQAALISEQQQHISRLSRDITDLRHQLRKFRK